MATAEQLEAPLKSFGEGDEQRFYAVAMQVARHSARQAHSKLALETREPIDEAKITAGRRDKASEGRDYEPASALLERVRKEREAAGPTAARGRKKTAPEKAPAKDKRPTAR